MGSGLSEGNHGLVPKVTRPIQRSWVSSVPFEAIMGVNQPDVTHLVCSKETHAAMKLKDSLEEKS